MTDNGKTVEELVQTAFDNGRGQGYEEGWDAGYEAGYEAAYDAYAHDEDYRS